MGELYIYIQGAKEARKGGAGVEWIAGRIRRKLWPQGAAVRHAALPDRGAATFALCMAGKRTGSDGSDGQYSR